MSTDVPYPRQFTLHIASHALPKMFYTTDFTVLFSKHKKFTQIACIRMPKTITSPVSNEKEIGTEYHTPHQLLKIYLWETDSI